MGFRDWQNEVMGFAFADPWALLLLLLVIALWVWRARRRGPALGFASVSLCDELPTTLRARCANLPLHLVGLGLIPVCLALARPQSLERIPLRSEGIDILLTIDLSSSMAQRDMDSSGRDTRLDAVKEVAKRFIEGRTDDRIGLVSFARYADVVCPSTLDHAAVQRFLAPLQHKRRISDPREQPDPEDGTAIGAALALSAKRLSESDAKSRVVILLSDGQETVFDISPEDAAKLAKDEKVRVYTIGAGHGRSSGLFQRLRKPDFTALRDIAKATDGRFFEAESSESLAQIFAEIDELERGEIRDPIYLADELFLLFLVIGAGLLFVAFVLRLVWIVEVP